MAKNAQPRTSVPKAPPKTSPLLGAEMAPLVSDLSRRPFSTTIRPELILKEIFPSCGEVRKTTLGRGPKGFRSNAAEFTLTGKFVSKNDTD